MNLFFENETGKDLGFDMEETAKKVVAAALFYIGCPYDAEVNLLITDNEGIHEMNRDFRQIDRPTDVLSFPMLEYDEPGNFEGFDEDCPDAFDPETGELLLGDIVISYEKVVSQAEEFGHSTLREYSFLIAHSMLHLFGFDHMEDDERKEMERMQEEILGSLSITR